MLADEPSANRIQLAGGHPRLDVRAQVLQRVGDEPGTPADLFDFRRGLEPDHQLREATIRPVTSSSRSIPVNFLEQTALPVVIDQRSRLISVHLQAVTHRRRVVIVAQDQLRVRMVSRTGPKRAEPGATGCIPGGRSGTCGDCQAAAPPSSATTMQTAAETLSAESPQHPLQTFGLGDRAREAVEQETLPLSRASRSSTILMMTTIGSRILPPRCSFLRPHNPVAFPPPLFRPDEISRGHRGQTELAGQDPCLCALANTGRPQKY